MSDQEKEVVKETAEVATEEQAAPETSNEVKMDSLFAFKEGMSSVYDENGKQITVTVLKFKPWIVSQIKTKDKDGYEAVQLACSPKKKVRSSAAEIKHLAHTGFENGAHFIKEIRQDLPEGIKLGQKLAIDSLDKDTKINVIGYSKGRGFSGVIKRHGHKGGPAAHGSRFHRQPGSIGNCEEPGRVIAGRKLPGHYGVERFTVKGLKVVEVIKEENVVLVQGPVPGSRNSLVELIKA